MSVAEDIRSALLDRGGQSLDELAASTGHNKKSLSSRLYDLKRWGQVTQDHNSAYWLAGMHQQEDADGATPSASSAAPPSAQERHVPISADQEEFERTLIDCDVRRARDTITRTLFGGDVYDLDNLIAVLEDARGYVNPNQARMILRYWGRYIDADLTQLAKLEERLGRPSLNGGGGGSDDGKFIEELGWTVQKDKDGDWVPQLGGDLSHRDALRWAATMNATRSARGDDDDDDDEDDAPRRRRRGGSKDREPTLLEQLKTYKDLFMPDTSSKDEEVKLLKDRLEQMEKERADERLDRLEAMVAAAVNRNPITEYLNLRNQLEEINPRSPVTDNSPTVQLVKDQTDKLDRGMNRIAGILEQAALRGHERIVPEEEYTPEQREAKAGELVRRLEQGNESKQLRNELFGR